MVFEISRVLKKCGLAVVIEPTLTHRTRAEALSFRGHHYVTNWKYLKSFKNNGLGIERYYLYYNVRNRTFRQKIMKVLYSRFNRSFFHANNTNTFLTALKQNILDGQNIFYCEKRRDTAESGFLKHEDFELIDRSHLDLDGSVYDHPSVQKAVELYRQLKGAGDIKNQ